MFDVLVPEHPGLGESETPAGLNNLTDILYIYIYNIEALGLNRAHLIGNSLGSWIAVELAVRDQHRLRTLVPVSPGGIHVQGVPTYTCLSLGDHRENPR